MQTDQLTLGEAKVLLAAAYPNSASRPELARALDALAVVEAAVAAMPAAPAPRSRGLTYSYAIRTEGGWLGVLCSDEAREHVLYESATVCIDELAAEMTASDEWADAVQLVATADPTAERGAA